MIADGRPALHVAADLSIDLDGVPVQVRATGADVHVHTADVRSFLAQVRALAGAATEGSSGRAELRSVAESLAEHHLTASLEGPSGLVATAGSGVDSRAGRALLGTRLVRLHPTGVVGRVGPAVAAGLVLVAVVALQRRGRHPARPGARAATR